MSVDKIGRNLLASVRAELRGGPPRPRDASAWYHYAAFGLCLLAAYALARLLF
jgi:hypothetical protein